MSCGIWKPLTTCVLNICLPIVTLIWKVYALKYFNKRKALVFLLLLSSSSLLSSPSFAVLTTALGLQTSPAVHFDHSQEQDIGLCGLTLCYHYYIRLYVNVCVQIISHGTISNLNTFQNSILMSTLLSTYSVHQKISFSQYLTLSKQQQAVLALLPKPRCLPRIFIISDN